VRPLAQWLSWVITASLSSVIVAILATLTLCGVMQYSSRFYLFLFILFFSFATAGFAFFVAAFFSKANLAAIVGPVALFITLLPRWIFFGSNRYEATTSKMWASLLPCTAFAFGADILSDYEYAQVGVQRSNLNDGVYNFNTSLGFLLFDTILYMILGWYFEQVLPRQYGVAKKWYFFLTPSFWKEVLPFCSKDSYADVRSDPQSNDMENGTVEHVSADAKLEISNLVKIYNPKKPPAINDLNLSMYDSEITCLLGHNGAGKSSTISVLTGLYPPTSGNCTIYGKSILHDLDKCRQSMGVCPQQNVLFNNLTVVEHLQFFERIKGVSSFEVEDRAKEVGLGDFLHTQAGQLSGGNKRKLQLAIALAGEPRLVLLDEPTRYVIIASNVPCLLCIRFFIRLLTDLFRECDYQWDGSIFPPSHMGAASPKTRWENHLVNNALYGRSRSPCRPCSCIERRVFAMLWKSFVFEAAFWPRL
jgi:ABC-type branched-subunit amino acid transport system ATPase component